jgi:hypothetical protein
MVLVLPFDEFSKSALKFALKDVFVSARGTGTMITVADVSKDLILSATSPEPPAAVQKQLKSEGFNVSFGIWTDGAVAAAGQPVQDAYLAAVSYRSASATPGLWLDAYPGKPTEQIVLRAMFDEFNANGEIETVTFEEFLTHANPNVVILSPDEVATYILQKMEC